MVCCFDGRGVAPYHVLRTWHFEVCWLVRHKTHVRMAAAAWSPAFRPVSFIGMFCSSLLAQPGSNYGSTRYRVVPGTAAHAERTRTCWSTEYYDYCRFLLPAPYIGFACFSLQVLLYSYLPLQQQLVPSTTATSASTTATAAVCLLYAIYSTAASPAYMYYCTCWNCCTAVSTALWEEAACETPLLGPIATRTRTYCCRIRTDINLRSSLSNRCCSYWYCPVYVPAVLRTGARAGTIFALCCWVSLIERLTVCRLKPCLEQYGGVVELMVLLALTMQHLLSAPLFTSTFLFHSVGATQDGMLTPDKVTPRGSR